MTTVAYTSKELRVHSQALNHETMLLYEWAIPIGSQLQAVYQTGVDKVLADYLSQNVADPIEWMLDRKIVRCLFEM